MLACVAIGAVVVGALVPWGIVRGAAILRSPEEQTALDDEQARILAAWAKEHGRG